MTETYRGSCHCGAVQFATDIDLRRGTLKCNCSICSKARNWLAMVKPEAFRLESGEHELSDYQFGRKVIHHLFCRHCGIHPFGWGIIPEMGGKVYAVNLLCLDDLDPVTLAAAPVAYLDGRNDDWNSPPAETRHL